MLTLAVQNAPVLRALAAQAFTSVPDLARTVGRDADNLRKTLKALEREGWTEALAITETGRALLPGLDVLEGVRQVDAASQTFRHAELAPSRLNPRKDFDSEDAREALDALRQSILTHGLQQNLVVAAVADANGVRQIVAGERRWRAIGLAIREGDLPADYAIPCRLQTLTDDEHEDLAVIENMVRRDLHPIEEGRAFRRWKERGRSTLESAEMVGRTQRHVQERIKLLELSDEDQTRMRLPRYDPNHLSLVGARHILQGKLEEREVAAELVQPAQVDLEELAPRALALTPAETLLLHEIEAAARTHPIKSAIGPTAKIRQAPVLSGAGNQAAARLVTEGLIMFGGGYPSTVTLLKPGVAWLRTAPGAFMPDDYLLRMARTALGLESELISEMEAEGDFHTPWLNLEKPPKYPAPDPAVALIGLEIMAARHAQKLDNDYSRISIARKLTDQEYEALRAAGLVDAYDLGVGRDGVATLGQRYTAPAMLAQHYPGCDNPTERDKHLARLRKELGLPPQGSGVYSTDWLNGPFLPSAEWIEHEARREVQAAEAEASRAAKEAAHAALADNVTAFEREAHTLNAAQITKRFRALLAAINAPAPWRIPVGSEKWDAYAFAANSARIGNSSTLANRLQMIGLNIAAGVAPEDWPPTTTADCDADDEDAGDEEPTAPANLDRQAYVAAVLARLQESVPSAKVADIEADLDDWLAAEGIEFGGDEYTWTAEDACTHAVNYLDNLEVDE